MDGLGPILTRPVALPRHRSERRRRGAPSLLFRKSRDDAGDKRHETISKPQSIGPHDIRVGDGDEVDQC